MQFMNIAEKKLICTVKNLEIVSEDDKIKDVIMKIIADKYGAVHTTASSEVKTNDNGELVW